MRERRRGEVKPFLDHLEDLRWTIIRMLVVLSVATLICYIFHPQLFTVIVGPLRAATAASMVRCRSMASDLSE